MGSRQSTEKKHTRTIKDMLRQHAHQERLKHRQINTRYNNEQLRRDNEYNTEQQRRDEEYKLEQQRRDEEYNRKHQELLDEIHSLRECQMKDDKTVSPTVLD